jgi:hypothetical protein
VEQPEALYERYLFWLDLPAGVLAKGGYDNPRLYSGDVIRFRLLLFNKLLALFEYFTL